MTRPFTVAAALIVTVMSTAAAAGALQQAVPPAESAAAAALASSPRHGEWVEVDAGADGAVAAWLVYPERATAAPVVVVVHEIFGLTDWIRSVADAFAAEGFIAIAPDLLSGKGPDGGGTSSLEAPTRTIRDLDPGEVERRLDAVAAHATALPAATDRFGVVGFCWGGSTSFRYATVQPRLSAAIVYYGGSPPEENLAKLAVPVLGLYGGDDARVNATIEPARVTLAATGMRYDVTIFDGAGHGFLRAQDSEERAAANSAAALAAWASTVEFFRELLEG